MLNPPRTREEAKKRTYRALWGMHKYVRTCCAWAVNYPQGWQCSRNPGHGPDGLYCRQHAAKIRETR